jgi:transglutaminase-like putative cysteine protease
MKLRAQHTTTYLYSEPVSICHTDVRLAPRELHNQRVLEHHLTVHPRPERMFGRTDYFGNGVTYFSLHEPHQTLTITADCLVEKDDTVLLEPGLTPRWEEARGDSWGAAKFESLPSYEYIFESPRVIRGRAYADYARPSFTPDRPLLEAAVDLCHRIYSEFHYDRDATTVATSVAEVIETRRGVCQDFAHFAIACLRSLGLAARYVSGYVKTSAELTGGEASHAWLAVFCPGFGWFDLDPTNDQLVNGDHLTLACGRDYSDVAPVKGVALGGGEQVVNVSVAVS